MATRVFLLHHGPYELPEGADPKPWAESTNPSYEHFAGCPHYGPDKGNLDKARTFKSAAAAKATNEFKYWGYEVVEAEISITLKNNTKRK
jgi:hypothetical protein